MIRTTSKLFLSILLALPILGFTANNALAANGEVTTSDADAKPTTTLKIAATDTVIYVGDLHCKTCAKKISRKLYAVKGVVKVRADVKADVAIITPQQKKTLDTAALWSAAQKAGFQPLKLVGPTGTFTPDPETKAPQRLAEAESLEMTTSR